ncbi:hypothetical protein FB567DRAFT_174752 [Paraphoma chrysanthemicola]|uniref:BZIP domain-containing protein n=1 Tax=Paraphoma chrysanthemicola TaxID=798071 RepID=A0A8K0REK7_9PLEO|nr:hypothetical protein FB567DRAFT_174752 [Paraphoma chrysanthemicola]
MTSKFDTHKQSNSLTSAFSTFDSPYSSGQQWTWPDCGGDVQSNFSIDTSFLTDTSSGQLEQDSQYEVNSPADPQRQFIRDASIPVHDIGDEILWQLPQPTCVHDLNPPSPRTKSTNQQDLVLDSTRAQVEGTGNKLKTNDDHTRASGEPLPVKRKRGRPRLDSYATSAQDVNSFSFQSSSIRELHLEKNRIAAAKCRERSKGVTLGLVAQSAELTAKNKALKADANVLREEVLRLESEVLLHAGCGSWAIDRYVERCAGDILGVEAPPFQPPVRRDSHINLRRKDPIRVTDNVAQENLIEPHEDNSSMSRRPSRRPSSESDEYDVLKLLNIGGNFDDPCDWEFLRT